MPKETINYPSVQSVLIEGDSPDSGKVQYAPPGPEFSIHWNNDAGGYVQLCVEFDVAAVEAYLADLRKHSPMDSRAFLYSETLSREDIQRMIRGGRRSRNAVFGGDE